MDWLIIFEALCFLLSIGFYVAYIPSVLSGKTKPTLSSWISWVIMDSAILAGMLAQGAISWQLVAYVMGTSVLLALCAWRGSSLGWKRLDSYCLSVSVLASALWAISGNPNIAIVLSLAAIVVGSMPMFVNTWKNSIHESILPWAVSFVGGIFSVLAIREWTIASALTPITIFVLQCIFMVILLRPKWLRLIEE